MRRPGLGEVVAHHPCTRLWARVTAAGYGTGVMAMDRSRMPELEPVLRAAYRAFNARDIEAALRLMHADVDWPNAWEGGRVVGHAAVRDYWKRQFDTIASNVEPQRFTEEPDGSVTVDVHQVVRDARSHELLSDSHVRHRYRFEAGLVLRMDVVPS